MHFHTIDCTENSIQTGTPDPYPILYILSLYAYAYILQEVNFCPLQNERDKKIEGDEGSHRYYLYMCVC